MAVAFKKGKNLPLHGITVHPGFSTFSFLEGHKISIWGIWGSRCQRLEKVNKRFSQLSFRLIALQGLKGPFSQKNLVFYAISLVLVIPHVLLYIFKFYTIPYFLL
jgi:hypothetical protein